jgi:hypothetical protein
LRLRLCGDKLSYPGNTSRLKGLPAEERLKGPSAEEVIQALSPEVREALARQLKANGSAAKEQ